MIFLTFILLFSFFSKGMGQVCGGESKTIKLLAQNKKNQEIILLMQEEIEKREVIEQNEKLCFGWNLRWTIANNKDKRWMLRKKQHTICREYDKITNLDDLLEKEELNRADIILQFEITNLSLEIFQLYLSLEIFKLFIYEGYVCSKYLKYIRDMCSDDIDHSLYLFTQEIEERDEIMWQFEIALLDKDRDLPNLIEEERLKRCEIFSEENSVFLRKGRDFFSYSYIYIMKLYRAIN